MNVAEKLNELVKEFEDRNDAHVRSCDSTKEVGFDNEIERLLKTVRNLWIKGLR